MVVHKQDECAPNVEVDGESHGDMRKEGRSGTVNVVGNDNLRQNRHDPRGKASDAANDDDGLALTNGRAVAVEQDERDTIRRQLANTLRSVCCQRMVPTADGGMRPALEIMINTISIRKAIEENQLGKLLPIIEGSRKIVETDGISLWEDQGEGMMSFNQCIYNLLQQGIITEERAMEKASNPQQLKMWLEGIFTSSGGITG
jgi:hypothetical protein